MAYLVSGWLAAEAAPLVDQWNLRLEDFITLLFVCASHSPRHGKCLISPQRFYVGSAFYGMAMFFIKVAILLNIIEIFWLDETLSRACRILLWANGIFYIIFTFLQIFSCRPINKSWDVFITHGTCLNTRLITLVAGAINTVSDLLILILPQRLIWGLQSPLRKKLAVSGLFSLGLLYFPLHSGSFHHNQPQTNTSQRLHRLHRPTRLLHHHQSDLEPLLLRLHGRHLGRARNVLRNHGRRFPSPAQIHQTFTRKDSNGQMETFI